MVKFGFVILDTRERTNRQTERQTDTFITILRGAVGGGAMRRVIFGGAGCSG